MMKQFAAVVSFCKLEETCFCVLHLPFLAAFPVFFVILPLFQNQKLLLRESIEEW
jgi:hypothetical protein